MTASGDIGILTTDRDLIVQAWDEWLEAATGVPAARARGRRLPEIAPAVQTPRFLARVHDTLTSGVVQVLSPAFHHAFLPCAPRVASSHFTQMQQRVTVGPLLDGGQIAGLLITIQDVTAQLDRERSLAAALASDDPAERRAAANSIAAAQRVESLEHFAPVLGADDWRVRDEAVRGLAAAADRELLRALVATMQREHRHFSTLSSALKLLTLSDVDLTEPLAELLQDPDADLRIQAALALGEQHQPGAVAPLLQALQDPDVNVRFHAIESLGRLRADAAIDPLIEVVESRDFYLAFAALDALALMSDSRIAPRLVPLLGDEDLREAVTHALRQLGDESVVRPLVEVLNRTPAAAAAVAQALSGIAERVVTSSRDLADVASAVTDTLSPEGRAHLLAAAGQGPAEAQKALACVLGWIPGDDTVAALDRLLTARASRSAAIESLVRHGAAALETFVARLGSEDPEIEAAAIGALGRLGSPRATAPLVALLDREPGTAIAACGALARIGDPAAFEPLLALVGRADAAVRQAAIGALNSIGHAEMPARVTALLQDPDPLVRESSVRIAGYFGYAGALPLVLACAADPQETVRVAALEHLAFFDGAGVLPALAAAVERGAPRVRAAAARGLARLEAAEAARLLGAALADEDHWVRYYAVRGLREHPAGREAATLVELAEQDPSVPVRIAAIDTLGAWAHTPAETSLVRCASSGNAEVAAAALRALGRLGGAEALDALRTNARSLEAGRRSAAVEGLGALGTAEAVAHLEWIAAAEGEPAVAKAAIAALAAIAASGAGGGDAAVHALLALCAVSGRGGAAASALCRLPAETVPAIAGGLQSTDPAVRRRTVEVLARFRRPEATRRLEVAFSDADPGVRETAASAVLRLGTASFDEVLRRLARQDPSKAVRRAAAAALAGRRSAP